MEKYKNPKLKKVLIREGIEVPLFTFPLLEQTGIVSHGFTTRLGGVSEGEFSTMNLSFTRGDKKEAVEENYRRLAEALFLEYGSFVCSNQTHTTNVIRVGKEDVQECGVFLAAEGKERKQKYQNVDGMITNDPDVTLITYFADCVPLYFVDPVHHAIGLSHSGWRGTACRMGQVTLEEMKREFSTDPKDVICAIGPSICQNCYEISEDVAEVFQKEFNGREEEILVNKGDGKYLLNLWRANEIVLTDAGVAPFHLTVTEVCTCCHPCLLFSHRASRGKRGNLAAVLALKKQPFGKLRKP